VCNVLSTYLQHIKHNMSVIDQLLAVLAPYECLGCAAEGNLLCEACTQQLTVLPERCYRCSRLSAGSLTCSDCRLASNLYRIRAGAAYSGVAKDLVWRLKSAGALAATRQMAMCLSPLLASEPGLTIVPVPTATSRVRGRGYDQAKLLARELSRQTRLPYLDCLARRGYTHQVGASRQQRLSQLNGAFRAKSPEKVHGTHILLVDDVVTTGATLEAAAALLAANGVARVSAIVFAQV
jgi:ComF family protein